MKKFLIVLVVLLTAAMAFALAITRDGELVTPQGSGTVTLDAGRGSGTRPGAAGLSGSGRDGEA